MVHGEAVPCFKPRKLVGVLCPGIDALAASKLKKIITEEDDLA